MSRIYEVTVEDTNDEPHNVRVKIDGYIPHLPATNWEPEQQEEVDWFFCDINGKFIDLDFEISDWQIRKVDKFLLSEIETERNLGDWG